MNDLKFAIRQLLKNPAYAAVAICSLALGIGAGTAVFSIINAILLRSLPVPSPQELRVLHWTGVEARLRSISGWVESKGERTTAECVSPEIFASLRAKAEPEAEIFAFAPVDAAVVQTRQGATTANGMIVSDNFFKGLGIRPAAGQLFVPGGSSAEESQQVVISHDWWSRLFDRAAVLAGRTISINGTVLEVIGALPKEFGGVNPGRATEFYVVLTPDSLFRERAVSVQDHWWLRMMARVRGNEARLKALLDSSLAVAVEEQIKQPEIAIQPGGGGLAFDRKAYGKPLWLMLAIVGIVLTVACANVAGLSLARGSALEFQWSVRAALGAGRWRLIRQSLAESVMIALLGGTLGVLLAFWGRAAILRLMAQNAEGLRYDLSFDLAVLGFSLTAALATAVLSGLLPALRAGFADPMAGLKDRARSSSPRLRTGKVLVVAQVTLSILLLASAGLYLRTLVNVRRIDAGFDTEKLLIFQLNAGSAGYKNEALLAYFDRVQSALAVLPGVKGTSLTMFPLLDNSFSSGGFNFVDHPADPGVNLTTSRLVVGDTFLETLGIPIVQGRGLNPADHQGTSPSIVVNETFARRYFPGQDAIGHRITTWRKGWRIVGVCGDARYSNIKEPTPPTIYVPIRQFPLPDGAYFVLRTAMDPMALAQTVQRTIAAIDPRVPAARLTSQTEVIDRTIGRERLLAVLCGSLAGFALILAAIGLYGLLAYNVERRRKEIGVRMAIGALPSMVARSIVREAAILVAIGIGLGVPISLAATRMIQNQLFGVRANDPLTLMAVTGTLMLVAIGAAWLPARRAAKVNPIEALRLD